MAAPTHLGTRPLPTRRRSLAAARPRVQGSRRHTRCGSARGGTLACPRVNERACGIVRHQPSRTTASDRHHQHILMRRLPRLWLRSHPRLRHPRLRHPRLLSRPLPWLLLLLHPPWARIRGTRRIRTICKLSRERCRMSCCAILLSISSDAKRARVFVSRPFSEQVDIGRAGRVSAPEEFQTHAPSERRISFLWGRGSGPSAVYAWRGRVCAARCVSIW